MTKKYSIILVSLVILLPIAVQAAVKKPNLTNLRKQVTFYDSIYNKSVKINEGCLLYAQSQISSSSVVVDEEKTNLCIQAPIINFFASRLVAEGPMVDCKSKLKQIGINFYGISGFVVGQQYVKALDLANQNASLLNQVKTCLQTIKDKYPTTKKADQTVFKNLEKIGKNTAKANLSNLFVDSCGKFGCFEKKFAKCQVASRKITMPDKQTTYKIVGKNGKNCKVNVKETLFNTQGILEGLQMNCLYNPAIDLNKQLVDSATEMMTNKKQTVCQGGLADDARLMAVFFEQGSTIGFSAST